jgi:secreted PhoX family phosphatase
MGRFYHEAVAVDPRTGFVYLSEDRDDGLLYRFRPAVVTSGEKRPQDLAVGDLQKGGVLEALRIAGKDSVLTQNWKTRDFLPGRKHSVQWVTIPHVDPDVDMERDPSNESVDPLERPARTAPLSVRAQGFRLGAAQFARGEGMLYAHGSVYLTCTNGGATRDGQVWRLETAQQKLSLMVEPNDEALLEGPDNLTLAPNGDLLVCEDGRGDDYVVGITPAGKFYRFARDVQGTSELAGACFSPDGQTFFVNTQNPGITFAIQGPWNS